MINRTKRKNSSYYSTQNSDRYRDLPEKQMSQNRYKQSKLPLRFLGKSKRKPELNFIMDNNFHSHFIYRDRKNEDNADQFIFQFKWPELGQMVNLCCDRAILPDLEIEYIEGSNKQEDDQVVWEAVLKSHLQKTIRRGKTDKALATANLMFDLCPLKLLRRLPIIMIEDVCLDLNCSTLVWLMVYFSDRLSRCFKNDQRIRLKPRIRNLILSEVYHLCQCPIKDEILYVSDCQKKLKSWESNCRNGEAEGFNQIYALQLRKIYGGMKGDLEMMDQYCLKWLKDPSSMVRPEFREFNDQLKKLTRKNFIIEAIDFHCCPWILDQLNSNTSNLISCEVIKETIWHASSCLNYRVNYTPCDAYVKTLQIFKDVWFKMAREVLHKYLLD